MFLYMYLIPLVGFHGSRDKSVSDQMMRITINTMHVTGWLVGKLTPVNSRDRIDNDSAS